MKYIKKEGAPADYITWCKNVAGTPDEHFEKGLRNPEKSNLKDALLQEQGYICAYTLRRIQKDTSHIEHIKPETLCRAELTGSDLNYENMVACFPRDGMKNPYRYGAPEKDNWWENDGKAFISPLMSICETRFNYTIKGEIFPRDKNKQAAKTIEILKLNHKTLIEDRKNAISEFLFGSSGDNPLSPKQVIRAIETIYERNNSDEIKAYCVAIYHSLIEFQKNEEKRKNKKAIIKKAIVNKTSKK